MSRRIISFLLFLGVFGFLFLEFAQAENFGDFLRDALRESLRNKYGIQENNSETQTCERIQRAIDYTHPTTRNFALYLARQYPGPYNASQVCLIFEHLQKNWRYVNDPRGEEYFASASESIGAGLAGDCDDFAIVMAALIQAIGGETRIKLARGPLGGHAFAEVCIGKNQWEAEMSINNILNAYRSRHIFADFLNSLSGQPYQMNYSITDDGYWLNLDMTTSPHPGGPYSLSYQETAVYPDGRIIQLKTKR